MLGNHGMIPGLKKFTQEKGTDKETNSYNSIILKVQTLEAVWIPALLLTDYEILGKLVNLVWNFLVRRTEIIILAS